jgi:hypothetical protein
MVHTTILTHLQAMLQFYGERGVIGFRKFLKAYLAHDNIPREALLSLLNSQDPSFIIRWIDDYYDHRA